MDQVSPLTLLFFTTIFNSFPVQIIITIHMITESFILTAQKHLWICRTRFSPSKAKTWTKPLFALILLEHVTETPQLPSLPRNTRYLSHKSSCFDWCTYGWALNYDSIDTGAYQYIILMNSSVRGPFMPTYLPVRPSIRAQRVPCPDFMPFYLNAQPLHLHHHPSSLKWGWARSESHYDLHAVKWRSRIRGLWWIIHRPRYAICHPRQCI